MARLPQPSLQISREKGGEGDDGPYDESYDLSDVRVSAPLNLHCIHIRSEIPNKKRLAILEKKKESKKTKNNPRSGVDETMTK